MEPPYDSLKSPMHGIGKAIDRVSMMFSEPENLTLRVATRKEIFHHLTGLAKWPGKVWFKDVSNDDAMEMLLNHDIELAVAHTVPNDAPLLSREVFRNGTKFVIHRDWFKGKNGDLNTIRDKTIVSQIPSLAYKRKKPPFLKEWVREIGLPLEERKI